MAASALLLLLCLHLHCSLAQVAWTPIYVDGNSQVDLWTQSSKGCRCVDGGEECACCVRDGGCPCGPAAPGRCTQCGLEEHCSNMCNVTIDSRYLTGRSGKSFGQIKSPSMEGPGFCWYLLQPDTGQRVEIQVYRLVSVGRFNGSHCEGGFLQLVDGPDARPRTRDSQICGSNERYAPPVVLFADSGPATLIFKISEPTLRSQFLAYFSFTPLSRKMGAGFHGRGGRRIEHTDCDWLYQDFSCRDPGSCVLTSPGYPGLYPPNRVCNYHIRTSSIHTQVTITFTALLLPHSHCSTDYVAVYQGSSRTNPLLTTLCANRKSQLTYPGPNLLVEFNSGSPVPPYDYNGFVATLEFKEQPPSTPPPHRSTDTAVLMDGTLAPRGSTSRPSCDLVIRGNETRSGHFDTRGRAWAPGCTITFLGRHTDVVHISLFNYKLRALSCQSSLEIYDGQPGEGAKPLKKICSPVTKYARDPSGRFLEQQAFVSKGNTMTILLRRQTILNSVDKEFVDGAYLFHDEQVGGTLQPDSLCDVSYYGLSSPKEGSVVSPREHQIFWNIEGTLVCTHTVIPAANQSVTLTVALLTGVSPTPHCHTQCGDAGCRCVTDMLPLHQMDHLLIASDGGASLSCLCGDFQPEWLPVSLRSWSAVKIVYSVADYSWTTPGFSFSASYTFHNDAVCGHSIITQPSGEIKSKNVSMPRMNLNYFYHEDCTWLLDSKVERQLTVEMWTDQSRPCSAWNMTVYAYDEHSKRGMGDFLHTFCPRDRNKELSIPWKTNTVILRLRAMTRTPPEYSIRWRSQVVRANTRTADPTLMPSATTTTRSAGNILVLYLLMLKVLLC